MSDKAVDTGPEDPTAGIKVRTENTLAAEPSTPAAPEQGDTSESASEEEQKTRSRGAEKRIRRLTAQRSAAERARDAAIAESQELRAKLEALESSLPKPAKPRFKDFKNEDEYAEALLAWSQADAKQDAARKKSRQKKQPAQELSQDEVELFLQEGREELGEEFASAYERAKEGKFALSRDMLEYLMDSDDGAELFVELSQKAEDAGRIAQLAPVKAAVELARLSRSLGKAKAKADQQGQDEAPRNAKGQFQKRGGSKAPPPGPKTEGRGVQVQDIDSATLDGNPQSMKHRDLDSWMRQKFAAHNAAMRGGR